MEKKERSNGLVKLVKSADCLVIVGGAKPGQAPPEKTIFLASIQAPKVGTNTRVDEPYGFEGREFLRAKLAGQPVQFIVEYVINEREYGIVYFKEENINTTVVKNGFGKVIEQKQGLQSSSLHEELLKAQDEAKKAQVGIWNVKDEPKDHVRKVKYSTEESFDAQELVKEAKKIDKPLRAVIEHVYNASAFSVYIFKFDVVIYLSLLNLMTPNADKSIAAEGKLFSEKLLLQRTVGVQLDSVGEYKNIYGRIHHPAGEIALQLLKNGYSKLVTPKGVDYDKEYFRQLKSNQQIAQATKLRIWKEFKATNEAEISESDKEFNARVIDVHSGDSLTVKNVSGDATKRIFLASVRAPGFGSAAKKDSTDQPYAWEAKEFLRKLCIGKKVKVEVEFARNIEAKMDYEEEKKVPARRMDFASVFLAKSNKNIGSLIIESGFATASMPKANENSSKYFEQLVEAENKAKAAKAGIHSNVQVPIPKFNDLTGVKNTAKAKSYITTFQQEKSQNGVVEFCMSGSKFKVRIPAQNCLIAFGIHGIRTIQSDKNQPEMEYYADLASKFAKDNMHQRNVKVEIENSDKKGNFFGHIFVKGKNYATMLIDEGLAMVNDYEVKNNKFQAEYEKAQQAAQKAEKGIWKKDLKLFTASTKESSAYPRGESLAAEIVDMYDATKFYVKFLKNSQLEKIQKELATFNSDKAEELKKPIRRGTVCAAKFSVDNTWYRARIDKTTGNSYLVQFIDYGNYEEVPAEALRKLPTKLSEYAPEAKQCKLAYIEIPTLNRDFGQEAAVLLRNATWGKKSSVRVFYEDGWALRILITPHGVSDVAKSVNAELLRNGLAKISKYAGELPAELAALRKAEDEAREKEMALWSADYEEGESDREDEP